MESIYNLFGMSSSSGGAAAAPSSTSSQEHTTASEAQDGTEYDKADEGGWQEVTTSSSSRRKHKKKKKKNRQERASKEAHTHAHDDKNDIQQEEEDDANDEDEDIDSLLVFGGHTDTVKKATQESGIPLASAHHKEGRKEGIVSTNTPDTRASRQVSTRSIGAEGTKQALRSERRKQEQEKRHAKRREKAQTSLKMTMNGLMAAQDAHASMTTLASKEEGQPSIVDTNDKDDHHPHHQEEEEEQTGEEEEVAKGTEDSEALKENEKAPKEEFMQALQQGRRYARMNKPASAISYVEKALKLAQSHEKPYWQMLASRDGGYIWSKAGRTRAAISAWEHELWAATLLASGIANQESGLSTEGWGECKKAIQNVYVRLAQAYESIAEYERRDTYLSLANQYDDSKSGDKALLALLNKVKTNSGTTTAKNKAQLSHDEHYASNPATGVPTTRKGGEQGDSFKTISETEEDTGDAGECAAKADEGIEAAIGDDWNICNSLLNRALFYKDKQARKTLLTPHSSTNATFLMLAAAKSRFDILRRLLQLRVARTYLDTEDANGLTALVWACKFGSSNAVNLLLEAGADVNVCVNGAGADVLPDDTVESLRVWHATPHHQRTHFRLPGDVVESSDPKDSEGGSHTTESNKVVSSQPTTAKTSNAGQPRELKKWEPEHENLQTLEEYLTLEEEEQLKQSLRQPYASADSGISKQAHTTGGLWDGDAEHGALDDTFLAGAVNDTVDEYKDAKGNWDQFAANEALFGVKADSFDESKYTTPLNINKFSAAQVSEAEKKASEIAAASTADEIRELDEEQAFASVAR